MNLLKITIIFLLVIVIPSRLSASSDQSDLSKCLINNIKGAETEAAVNAIATACMLRHNPRGLAKSLIIKNGNKVSAYDSQGNLVKRNLEILNISIKTKNAKAFKKQKVCDGCKTIFEVFNYNDQSVYVNSISACFLDDIDSCLKESRRYTCESCISSKSEGSIVCDVPFEDIKKSEEWWFDSAYFYDDL